MGIEFTANISGLPLVGTTFVRGNVDLNHLIPTGSALEVWQWAFASRTAWLVNKLKQTSWAFQVLFINQCHNDRHFTVQQVHTQWNESKRSNSYFSHYSTFGHDWESIWDIDQGNKAGAATPVAAYKAHKVANRKCLRM
jgi:hypothetical protein